ncbi:PAS domain-containing sensor histidine kinase [Pseudomonas putida]
MKGLFERWQTVPAREPDAPAGVGLQLWLDAQGAVQRLSGPLRSVLALPVQGGARVHDYLHQHSWLVLEGVPGDWQGQPLDLDFRTATGHALRTRGWLLQQGSGWLLQLFDIGDLLREQHQHSARQGQQQLAQQIGHALRGCSEERLLAVTQEQLQRLARHWQVPALRLVLREQAGWRSYACNGADWPWPEDERLQPWLAQLPPDALLDANRYPQLLALCGGVSLALSAFTEGLEPHAWLLCAGGALTAQQGEAQALLTALAEPLLSRQRLALLRQQNLHLGELQRQLGAGCWEWPLQGPLRLDPLLAKHLGLPCQASLEQWLQCLHPADREPALLALQQARASGALDLSLRLLDQHGHGAPRWFHWLGQAQGGRLRGVVQDISALKAQELQAQASKARLENLIASSPAVIYIQRYAEGALHSDFYSASLMPLLGWAADSEQARQPGLAVHPDDRPLWLQRTRALLQDGQARCRYRLRDSLGGYHWVLDEARLLRNDLGQPVEVVGLWLDVSEATEAAERVRQSEERYRVLVEDSPAIICRYRPDLTLVFANRPLAEALHCSTAQLPGLNLRQWMSDGQHAAFLQRLQSLTPEQPLSSAEICLQLPGREHAWWVWAERGLFDEHGRLLEVQAVGRDNSEVRRSQRQLQQGAKMATLGQLAAGMVHEMNQPLNVMCMTVGNALKHLEKGSIDPAYLQDKLLRIETQIARAARLVEHLRVYGRRSEVEQQPFVAWAAVEGAVGLLEEGLRRKGVALRLEPPVERVQVLGHQDQLEQVLINLMVNARDALLGGKVGQPWIQLSQVVEGGQLWLLVEDNAGGVDPQLLERIFEPFFTTKPAGLGTGLGLSVSYGIVEAMGGTLRVSNGAEGARFCVALGCYCTN